MYSLSKCNYSAPKLSLLSPMKKTNELLEAMTHHKPEQLLNCLTARLGPPPGSWSSLLLTPSLSRRELRDWRGLDKCRTWASQAPLRTFLSAALRCFLLGEESGRHAACHVLGCQPRSSLQSGTYPTDLHKESGRSGSTWEPGSRITHWRPQPFQSKQHDKPSCQGGSAPAAA